MIKCKESTISCTNKDCLRYWLEGEEEPTYINNTCPYYQCFELGIKSNMHYSVYNKPRLKEEESWNF